MTDDKKIRAAIVGYGNIGRYALQALREAPDFEIAGIVRRNPAEVPFELQPFRVVSDIEQLESLDVALVCSPSREVERTALEILKKGICTADSFDIHDGILALRRSLGDAAGKSGAAAVIASGWDPGSDSVVRTLMQAIVPKGITYTNFGPGMSMGHSVCAKSKPGVKDALSMTIPAGSGVHRRMVYVELEAGADFSAVEKAIKSDDYFAKDDTHVFAVDSIDTLKDMGHGVRMTRKGVSGVTQNQRFEFRMTINNPALTAQVMTSCARAAAHHLKPGAYTVPEIAPMDLLPGDRDTLIKTLV